MGGPLLQSNELVWAGRCLLAPLLAQWLGSYSFSFQELFFYVLSSCPVVASARSWCEERLLCSPFSACDNPGFQVNRKPEGEPCMKLHTYNL